MKQMTELKDYSFEKEEEPIVLNKTSKEILTILQEKNINVGEALWILNRTIQSLKEVTIVSYQPTLGL